MSCMEVTGDVVEEVTSTEKSHPKGERRPEKGGCPNHQKKLVRSGKKILKVDLVQDIADMMIAKCMNLKQCSINQMGECQAF